MRICVHVDCSAASTWQCNATPCEIMFASTHRHGGLGHTCSGSFMSTTRSLFMVTSARAAASRCCCSASFSRLRELSSIFRRRSSVLQRHTGRWVSGYGCVVCTCCGGVPSSPLTTKRKGIRAPQGFSNLLCLGIQGVLVLQLHGKLGTAPRHSVLHQQPGVQVARAALLAPRGKVASECGCGRVGCVRTVTTKFEGRNLPIGLDVSSRMRLAPCGRASMNARRATTPASHRTVCPPAPTLTWMGLGRSGTCTITFILLLSSW